MKFSPKFDRKLAAGTAVVSSALVPALAFATPPDLTALTGAVDFTSASTAVLAIAGLAATLYVVIKASRIVLGMIRGR
jgi:hypothetical protein